VTWVAVLVDCLGRIANHGSGPFWAARGGLVVAAEGEHQVDVGRWSIARSAVAIIPSRLRPGAQIRVVAPARSLAMISPDTRAVADRRLGSIGLKVTFGQHVESCDDFLSSSVAERVADLHDAFADPQVDGILTVIGGFNSNQLLPRTDYDLIAANPKVFCGFSDITALANAIYARTGLVTYSGPHFASFGMARHFDYTEAGFRACLFDTEPLQAQPAPGWSDDEWWLDQDHRQVEASTGWWVINPGRAEGTVVGGNQCTFNLLHGTEFMPDLDGSVLFLEDDATVKPWDFDRDLVSIIQQPGFDRVRALVIGRFQRASGMTRPLLEQIVTTKPELSRLPVVANVDFGHTTPFMTFPIGGTVQIVADPSDARLTITQH
jgi:muramoyltetrapeptide carboxypeptidase LdcA involved in peptidoglycan recycling